MSFEQEATKDAKRGPAAPWTATARASPGLACGAYEFNSFKPPRFSGPPQLTPDGWKLNITGAANQWVLLQSSSDLKNWEDVWSGWMGTDGVRQCTGGDTGPKVMFYRVVVE
jgi:hypothetical protein